MNSELTTIALPLANVLRRAGFTTSELSKYLGTQYWAALRRGEPSAAAFSLKNRAQDDLALLIRLFLLHEPVGIAQLKSTLGARLYANLVTAGVLGQLDTLDPRTADVTGATEKAIALIDVQPHLIHGTEQLVFSDIDASIVYQHVPGPDHVLGVGAASVSLINSTPTSFVDSVLDLGTGSGVQALSQVPYAGQVVATDIHQRALDFAAATFSAAQAPVEVLAGAWFEPVSGRKFDRIVANPPFVVGLPEINHVYRDSGLNLDGATQKVATEVVEYLNLGGTAHLLGSWVHQAQESWQSRIASWLPDTGVSAWVLQRDIVDPSHYVGTWLKDESLDPRSPAGKQKTLDWLQHFHDMGVSAIGFGFIAIKRIGDDEVSEIVIEEMPQHLVDDLGAEVEEYFLRMEWLRMAGADEILKSRFMLRPTVAKEVVSIADAENQVGFVPAAYRLTRTDGPRWSHDIDHHIGSLVGGLHPSGLPLAETLELYAQVHSLDAAVLKQEFVPIIVDLIRHGLVLPAALVNTSVKFVSSGI